MSDCLSGECEECGEHCLECECDPKCCKKLFDDLGDCDECDDDSPCEMNAREIIESSLATVVRELCETYGNRRVSNVLLKMGAYL